jgi:transposase
VEIFHQGDRIAIHLRGSGDGKHTTAQDHMPSSHRRYADWTLEKILREARGVGASTEMFCQLVLDKKPHPEQGFRTCMGVVRLSKMVGVQRLEAACLRALQVGALNYGSVKSILDNRLEGHPAPRRRSEGESVQSAVPHANIRGSSYYH